LNWSQCKAGKGPVKVLQLDSTRLFMDVWVKSFMASFVISRDKRDRRQ